MPFIATPREQVNENNHSRVWRSDVLMKTHLGEYIGIKTAVFFA